MKKLITQAELKELAVYNPETGVFTWTEKGAYNRKYKTMGYKHHQGYLTAVINKKYYSIHRLAFLYMEGYFPENQVDHINGIRDDNRWCNLREVTQLCQMQNMSQLEGSLCKYKGVTYCAKSDTYIATIGLRGVHTHIGIYDCPLEAALARITFEDHCDKWNCDARDWNRNQIFEDLAEAIKTQDTSKWIYTPVFKARNPTGYLGVHRVATKSERYTSRITRKNKTYDLNAHDTAREAAIERDKFIVEKGWPHELNFPELQYRDEPYEE